MPNVPGGVHRSLDWDWAVDLDRNLFASIGSGSVPRGNLVPRGEKCSYPVRELTVDCAPFRREGLVTVSFNLFDVAGFVGVFLIVIAYLLLQLDKLPSSSLSFSLFNAAGSLLIILSLLFKFNASAFLIEVFWFLISLLGLSKWLIARKKPPD
jgi:hypothetical protein